MRTVLIKRSTDLLYAPREFRQEADLDHWPKCHKCDVAVEAIEMAHLGSTSCEFIARCHGEHDCLKIKWDIVDGEPPTDAELGKVISNLQFFDKRIQVG